MDKLKQHFSKIRIPQPSDAVYKDECMYSFDCPDSPTGLYVCLNTYLGLGRQHVQAYSAKTGNCVFLHRTRTKKELPVEKESEPEKKIARLAIGVDGGFNPDAGAKKYEYTTTLTVVILPEFDIIPYPNEDLPQLVLESVAGIERAEGVLQKRVGEAAAAGVWDGELRKVSAFAEGLLQLDNGVKIPPRGWQCSRCDLCDNLWLNLTDGAILCGRKQMDGSGGNNHAVEHYDTTKHPLAVKLGTITADGKADVFSYGEDDMVIDPHLVKHLAHWGINVAVMEKTDKTMAEMEIDYNQSVWEYSRLTESGQKLVPVFGPGFTGLSNLGNSCYINSVVQLLLTVPPFVERYFNGAQDLMTGFTPDRIPHEFDAQMAKLASGLLSGRYSEAPSGYDPEAAVDLDSVQPGVAPVLFRALVGKGHSEFSTKKQQDAMEYLEHVLKLVERSSLKSGVRDPGHCFRFGVEDKFTCSESESVRYVTRGDLYLPLPVLVSEATNMEQVSQFKARKEEAESKGERFNEDCVRAHIPFNTCLSQLVAPEVLQAHSSAVNKVVDMQRQTRLTSFPDYLFIQLVKFGINDSWEPVKFDVSVPMPSSLDISVLQSAGPQEGENIMPDVAEAAAPQQEVVVDEAVVKQISEMGFNIEACRKAVHFTGNQGSEVAMQWMLEHMSEPDFNEPLVIKGAKSKDSFMPNAEGVMMLESMGFTSPQARLALKETQNNLERAADWLFSHQPELEQLLAQQDQKDSEGSAAATSAQQPDYTNGDSKYEMVGFVSHMGSSIHVGHYVCHIKKDGQWTIFNDNKVSKSVAPPFDLGYLYLYKRLTS